MTSAPVPSRSRHVNRNRSGQDNPRSSSDRDGDVRGQIRRLRAEGGTYRSIAAAAGLAAARWDKRAPERDRFERAAATAARRRAIRGNWCAGEFVLE